MFFYKIFIKIYNKNKKLGINKKIKYIWKLINGVPKGSRTPVSAVKGQCPRPLDDRD
jgi:hypothetical protein